VRLSAHSHQLNGEIKMSADRDSTDWMGMVGTFILNDEPMSTFEIRGLKFNAFSGMNEYRNKVAFSCVPKIGPIPVGYYYIIDRPKGGWKTQAKTRVEDMFRENKKGEWFALYAADGKVDDETFCNDVMRGQFRLHPGTRSEGCVTFENKGDFDVVRQMLLQGGKYTPSGLDFQVYGAVRVIAQQKTEPKPAQPSE
jgi:hypothetical protein